MFLDEAEVEFVSGDGGSGSVSFHREKHVPRGGPNGADGGRGGDVVLIADRNRRTLYDFKLKQVYEADNGSHALGNKRGKNGKSIEVRVPVGTIVHDIDLGEILVDLNIHGMTYKICAGGAGGKGNLHYVSSVRQVPNFAQKGAPGDRVRAKLELKLLADVGLIGLPNAGKSTLLSRCSAAKPKIADYPFTTIVPNLGVVRIAESTFTMADMPGLIKDASTGHGLGHQFLKHVERTKVLVHVVDAFPIDGSEPLENYKLIEHELKNFSEEIWSRPRIIVLNKADLAPIGDLGPIRVGFETFDKPLFVISAVSGEGLEPLLYEIKHQLELAEPPEPPVVTMKLAKATVDDTWEIHKIPEGWEVTGRKVRRMVAMTDLNNRDALRYLHRRLNRMGVIERLREEGAQEGDTVVIGEAMFDFNDDN